MTRPPKPKYEVIENTLDKITRKPRTKATYRSYINMYFRILGVNNPDKYFTAERDYTADIWKVAKEIDNIPTKTQQTFISCVKRFLIRNNIEIKTMEWQDIYSRNEIKKAYALTDDIIPTANQLKHLLQLANLKMKILVTFLSATGCRINEALSLTWKDIDMEKRMVKLSPEITKKTKKRYTFFTPETKEILEIWQRERNNFINHSMKKSVFVRNQLATKGFEIKKKNDEWIIYKDGKSIDRERVFELDQRVFPFTPQNAQAAWILLLEKAGSPFNEKDTNPKLKFPRYRFHIHCLRKFWFHKFQGTQANKNHIDFMGGHQSLLDATYTNFLEEPEKLKETYDEYSSCLAIFEREPDLTDVHEQLAEKDKEIKELNERLGAMDRDLRKLMIDRLTENDREGK